MINYSRLKVGSWAKAYAGIVVNYSESKQAGMITTERSVLCGWLVHFLKLKLYRRRQMDVKVEISSLDQAG